MFRSSWSQNSLSVTTRVVYLNALCNQNALEKIQRFFFSKFTANANVFHSISYEECERTKNNIQTPQNNNKNVNESSFPFSLFAVRLYLACLYTYNGLFDCVTINVYTIKARWATGVICSQKMYYTRQTCHYVECTERRLYRDWPHGVPRSRCIECQKHFFNDDECIINNSNKINNPKALDKGPIQNDILRNSMATGFRLQAQPNKPITL